MQSQMDSTLKLSPLEPSCSHLDSGDFQVVAVLNGLGPSCLWHATAQPLPQSFTNGVEKDENQNGSGDECYIQ